MIQNESRQSALTGNEQEAFLKTRSETIRELRANGVRPKPLDRLLSELGYDYAAPIRGRAEAIDRDALKQLVRPRNGTPKNKSAVTPPTPPDAEATPPKRGDPAVRLRSAAPSTRPSDQPSSSPRDVHRPGGLSDFEFDDRQAGHRIGWRPVPEVALCVRADCATTPRVGKTG